MTFSSVLSRLHLNHFVRNVAMLASGTAAGQIVIVLGSPVLTRLYSPNEFGIFAVFYAILGVVAVISSLRYEMAIPLPHRDRDAAHVLMLAIFVNFFMIIASIILVIFAREYIAKWSKSAELVHYLWLLPLGVASFGLNKILSYWASRKKSFNILAKTRLKQNLSIIIIQIGAGLAHVGAAGLILGQIIGQIVGVIPLIVLARKNRFVAFQGIRLKRLCIAARRHSRFPKLDSPASLLDTASEQLPAFLFATLFNPGVAGFYLLANRVLSVPLAFIGQSVAQVLYSEAAQAGRDGRLGALVNNIIKTLTALCIVPSLLIFLFAPDLFSLIFGDEWRTAGAYAMWMIIGISAQFVYSPISLIFLATDGQYLNFLLHAISLILRTGAIVFGWVNNSPLMAVIGFSVAGFLIYFSGIILIIARSRQVADKIALR